MASDIRGLTALGKSEDSYGALLVIILGKLPAEIRSNPARSHINPEWILSELEESFKTEIRVLESRFSNEMSKKFLSLFGDSSTLSMTTVLVQHLTRKFCKDCSFHDKAPKFA